MSSLDPSSLDPAKSRPAVRYMDTACAYDIWSKVYDTDDNFLQALDTIEMKTLLPAFLERIRSPKPWKLIDLGCGTGRNTISLLRVPGADVVGLELSPKMLEVARSRADKELGQIEKQERPRSVKLEQFDMIRQRQPPDCALEAVAVISTLVIEHIPIDIFFKSASRMLAVGGVLLLTNMHSEMGNVSQAGFMDAKTGEKVRTKSYAHSAENVVAGARRQEFKLERDVLERKVEEASINDLGERAKKWAGVLVWYGMMFRKMDMTFQEMRHGLPGDEA